MHVSHNAAPVHRVNEVIGVRDTIRGGIGCLPLTQSRVLPRVIEFKTGDKYACPARECHMSVN